MKKARSSEQIKEISKAGENAAFQYILSRLDKKLIKSLDISITSEKKEGTTFNVEVALELEAGVEINVDQLAEKAAEAALTAIDEKMRET